jgi:hypothetical protein
MFGHYVLRTSDYGVPHLSDLSAETTGTIGSDMYHVTFDE